MQVAGAFHSILNIVAAAPALRALELRGPYPCHPLDTATHATLATFRKLESLRLQRLTLGQSVLLQQVKVAPDHPLATLNVLELKMCGLGNREAQHLGALALYMTNLRELSLPDNEIGKRGVELLLGPWVGKDAQQGLRALDLSGNRLGGDGAPLLLVPLCADYRKAKLDACSSHARRTKAMRLVPLVWYVRVLGLL
jgi:Leucine Rich repeat